MHRETSQLSWSDGAVADKGRNAILERIAALIDWGQVEKLLGTVYASDTGRPAYPPLVMVKALLLAQWYSLSDPKLEEVLADRISFRRFVGLSLEDSTPDHSTLFRFRRQLADKALDQALFNEINTQLDARGLILKRGTLMDATLLEAQASRPGGEQKAARSEVDPDADWTRLRGRSYFGYKAHVGVDAKSGLVRRARLTPAKIAESLVADDLICGDEKAVYADRGYTQRARRERLKAQGIRDRIMYRRNNTQAVLPDWQVRRNQRIAKIRWQVERIFGTLKRTYNYTRVRYYSLKANTAQLLLLLTAFNLRRAVTLTA